MEASRKNKIIQIVINAIVAIVSLLTGTQL